MTEVTVYGIANCDTIKKARNWLNTRDIDYLFHDYRKQGLDANLLASMDAQLGWNSMLNRRGTTWRNLPEADKSDLDRGRAIQIMLQHPALIKRPILAHGASFYLGYDEQRYREIFR